MIHNNEISDIELKTRMMQNEICCGGNIKLGIHGKMNCISGKRMKKENCFYQTRKPYCKVIDLVGIA
jgi:hypothetical protein